MSVFYGSDQLKVNTSEHCWCVAWLLCAMYVLLQGLGGKGGCVCVECVQFILSAPACCVAADIGEVFDRHAGFVICNSSPCSC